MIQGERAALQAHAAEIAAFDPQAVVDSICYVPKEAEDLVALFPKVRRVVFISSVDAYGEDIGASPVTERARARAGDRLWQEQAGLRKAAL